jgi:signal transduction histidine kinase
MDDVRDSGNTLAATLTIAVPTVAVLRGADLAPAGGAGLGLAITRDIVRRHRGTIAIDGAHRPGTRFVVTLPTVNGQ